MNWKNHGDWHIDHIYPCSKFYLNDPEEQKICFNYKNLAPLWATGTLITDQGIRTMEHGNL